MGTCSLMGIRELVGVAPRELGACGEQSVDFGESFIDVYSAACRRNRGTNDIQLVFASCHLQLRLALVRRPIGRAGRHFNRAATLKFGVR